MENLNNIQLQIGYFKEALKNSNKQNSKVSAGNVGWHIAHSLLVMIKLISVLETSDVATFKPKFSLLKWAMFTFNKIPRGKRKAPQVVQPPQEMEDAYFEGLFLKVNDKINLLENLSPNSKAQHPALGLINKDETIKFFYVHNKHHLAIIEDIMAA